MSNNELQRFDESSRAGLKEALFEKAETAEAPKVVSLQLRGSAQPLCQAKPPA